MSDQKVPADILAKTRDWLQTFPAIEDNKPLLIGIADELLKQIPPGITEAAVRLALAEVTARTAYLTAITRGGYRCGLDGMPVETKQGRIHAHHMAYAKGVLTERRRWESKQIRARVTKPGKPESLTDYGKAVKRAAKSAKQQPRTQPEPNQKSGSRFGSTLKLGTK